MAGRESNGLLGRAIASHGMYSHCCDRTGCPGDTGILMEKEHAPISAYYIVLSENNASLFDQTFVIIDEVDDRGKRLLLNYDGMGQILNGLRIVVSV